MKIKFQVSCNPQFLDFYIVKSPEIFMKSKDFKTCLRDCQNSKNLEKGMT